jgi:hypothetical protein
MEFLLISKFTIKNFKIINKYKVIEHLRQHGVKYHAFINNFEYNEYKPFQKHLALIIYKNELYGICNIKFHQINNTDLLKNAELDKLIIINKHHNAIQFLLSNIEDYLKNLNIYNMYINCKKENVILTKELIKYFTTYKPYIDKLVFTKYY